MKQTFIVIVVAAIGIAGGFSVESSLEAKAGAAVVLYVSI